MEQPQLISALQSILFASDHPVPIEQLLQVFGDDSPPKARIEEAIESLRSRLEQEEECGLELREAGGGYQFVTKKKNAEWVRKFLESRPFRLSRTALEVLSIIAYRQPVTRAEIDQVRGVDSSHLVRMLMEKGIVKMGGKSDVPGKPVQYGTSQKFLELMGLKNLSDLPPLSELKELQGDQPEDPQAELEKGLERFISDQVSHTQKITEKDAGLEEIESLIAEVKSKKEVFASPLHAEIAAQNEEALDESPKTKRKSAKAEEITENFIDAPVQADEISPEDMLPTDTDDKPPSELVN